MLIKKTNKSEKKKKRKKEKKKSVSHGMKRLVCSFFKYKINHIFKYICCVL